MIKGFKKNHFKNLIYDFENFSILKSQFFFQIFNFSNFSQFSIFKMPEFLIFRIFLNFRFFECLIFQFSDFFFRILRFWNFLDWNESRPTLLLNNILATLASFLKAFQLFCLFLKYRSWALLARRIMGMKIVLNEPKGNTIVNFLSSFSRTKHTIQEVKFLSKNSILTKPQYFHEFFTQIFFDKFSREIKVVNS